MANNYAQYAAHLSIPEGVEDRCKEVIENTLKEREEQGEWVNVGQYRVDGNGVLFQDDGESFNAEDVAAVVEALFEEFDLEEPFICTYAFTCDKARPGEFGGGGFMVRKDKPTEWVDAYSHLQEIADKDKENI